MHESTSAYDTFEDDIPSAMDVSNMELYTALERLVQFS
jgi:hypothetical protein